MKPGLLTLAARATELPAEKIADALSAVAENFLGAGGTVSLIEWAAMPDEERRALYVAARGIAIENARTLAREILRGQLDPAALLGPIAAPDEKAAG